MIPRLFHHCIEYASCIYKYSIANMKQINTYSVAQMNLEKLMVSKNIVFY